MGKSNIIKALEELEKKDIYSLILFSLYRLKDVPEYSTLGELVYVLDNENFIKFLNYYGGKTIKVPTVQELSAVLNALFIFERQQNTDIPLNDLIKELNLNKKEKADLVKALNIITELLTEYDFKRETK